MSATQFESGQRVRHIKTGVVYLVIFDRSAGITIEKTGELCYGYRKGKGHPNWIRPVAEMEDGRFELMGN